MKRYPVAGKLLEQPLLFGLTRRDLEVAVFPAFLLAIVSGIDSILGIDLPGVVLLGVMGLGVLIALGILWRTPAGQYPRGWSFAVIRHRFGPTRYLWVPVEPAHAPGRYRDELRSVFESTAPPVGATLPDSESGSASDFSPPVGQSTTSSNENDQPPRSDGGHPRTTPRDTTAKSSAPSVRPADDTAGHDKPGDCPRHGDPSPDQDYRADGGREQPPSEETSENGVRMSRERPHHDPIQFTHRLTRESVLTQDTLAFDYVRDDGVIVIDNDGDISYVGLVEVTPTSWLALADEARQATVHSFASVLLGVTYPIQILALPREFNIDDHTDRILTAAQMDQDAPAVLKIGRIQYLDWLRETVGDSRIKVRDFFIAVRVDRTHVRAAIRTKTADTSRLRRMLGRIARIGTHVGGRLRNVTGESADTDVIEARCLTEVQTRQSELAASLSQTAVAAEPMRERHTVMDILYRYYNNAESPLDEYSPAGYTNYLRSGNQPPSTDTETTDTR